MSNELEKSIIKTLAFFDVFDYPLTNLEIFKWLYRPDKKYSLLQVEEALENSEFLKNEIASQEGFYSLKNREHLYLKRKQNNNLAERKFRRACILASIYRYVPFVRMIAICNTLAYSNAKETSDIDLFIIAKKNTIWLARFFTIFFVRVLGQRPEPDNKKDTFCLSFFIEEDSLNIRNTMLHKDDIYYPYWISQLMPLYDPDGLYQKFLVANDWYLQYLPNSYPNQFSKEVRADRKSKIVAKITQGIFKIPFLGDYLHSFLRELQIKIIDRNLKSLINVDTRIIVNEKMLKFYPNDNRELFFKRWQEKVHNILNLAR